MNWFHLPTWGKSLISTSLCLVGCSIGSMTTIYLLAAYHWLLILGISFIVGYISCAIFIFLWNIFFRKMKFREAFNSSSKMSFVPMCIMMLTENLVMIFIHSNHITHEMRGYGSHNLLIMVLAMAAGFLIVFPYNYYTLFKTDKACHQ